jgi:hypothetical protein
MNTLATLLLVVGTIVGVFGGGKLPQANPYITGLGILLLAAGGVILYLERRRLAAAPVGSAGTVDVLALIRVLPERLQLISDAADELTLAQIADRIGELDTEYFRPISDAAPALLGSMGTERFASVFGVYAGGERLISRAWSAAVDQHRPETLTSLREGISRIRAAAAAIDAGGSRAA